MASHHEWHGMGAEFSPGPVFAGMFVVGLAGHALKSGLRFYGAFFPNALTIAPMFARIISS